MSNRIIKVLLVDDHAVVRNGVRLMLDAADDIAVTGEAETAAEALLQARSGQYDVVLLDINLPSQSGLDLIKPLRNGAPHMAVLVFSIYAEEIYAIRAFKHGAAGYLTKNSSAPDLIAAVRKVAAGGKFVSPALMEKMVGMLGGPSRGSHEALSHRELEVLRRLAAGESLVAIAAGLGLSPSTVTTYRARILEKMDMKSNAELTRYAVEHGLL